MVSTTDGSATRTCATNCHRYGNADKAMRHSRTPHLPAALHMASPELKTLIYWPQPRLQMLRTCWKRRSRAGSFSMYLRNSLMVVAPMHRSCPRPSIGFSRLPAQALVPSAQNAQLPNCGAIAVS